MNNLRINLKKEKAKKKSFQFTLNRDIEIKLDRLWKQFRDEYPSKSELVRFLIDEAYKQNIEGK